MGTSEIIHPLPVSPVLPHANGVTCEIGVPCGQQATTRAELKLPGAHWFDWMARAQGLMTWLMLAAISTALVWVYWHSMFHLAERWYREPEYSHGFCVPLVALGILWWRRSQVSGMVWQGSWWGLLLIAGGVALRFISVYGFYTAIGDVALLPSLAGLVVLGGGWRALRWALPGIAFLVFMIPLPGAISDMLAGPLQRVATLSATYLLQLVGIPATAEGNVILLAHGKIGVVEACSGLRMLILFFAVSTAVAIIVQRTWIERIILVASAVPIALLVNIVRIAATGMFYEWISPHLADAFFHDVGGWLMGPAALGLLLVEIKFIEHVTFVIPRGPLVAISDIRPTK